MITKTQIAVMLCWIIGHILLNKDDTLLDHVIYIICYLGIGIPLFMFLNSVYG